MDTSLKHVFATAINAIEAAAAIAASNAQRATLDAERHAAFAKEAVEKIKAAVAAEELPSAVLDESEEPTCDICGYVPPWREMDTERGICMTCAEHFEDSLKYYTEEFAHASANGKDALSLLVLRQRADNCRDFIAAAAASYDGDLEAHYPSVEEKMLNKRAAECLGRLPVSFEPWWKDTWSHEKWCEMGQARDEVGWPVEKGAPIVQRLAAMFVAEEKKVYELKKKHLEEKKEAWEEGAKKASQSTEALMKLQLKELEAKHEKVLEKIQQAHTQELQATEKRHQQLRLQDNAEYAKCLAPLIDVRDKMRAECDKKCGEHDRRGYAMGYAFADQKWNPVYKAVCEELEAARKEGANHQDAYIRLFGERDELVLKEADLMRELDESAAANEKLEAQVEALRMELASAKGNLEGTEVAAREVTSSSTQVVEGLRKELTSTKADLIRAQDSAKKLQGEVDAATKLPRFPPFQAMHSDLERLNAENKALREQIEEDKQMVQRHLKENAEITALEKEEIRRLQEEYKDLQKKHEALLELVDPTIKLMKSNPELFGGEARGTSSPRPPHIIRLKEEDTERALNFLRPLLAPSRPCLLVESPSTALPGIVEVEPSTEGLCMALTKAQYEEMVKAAAVPTLLAVPHECRGHTTSAGIRYKHASSMPCTTTPPLPASPPPSPILVPDQPTECGAAGCIDCAPVEAKPKPNYNHPNWPSPITKRFAKHLAKHSGKTDPKTIKTHEDALEYIAKRGNISVETLLQWTMKHYQSFSEPWTLVEGPSKFHMGTAPATWWC
jgi:hypothetical protein